MEIVQILDLLMNRGLAAEGERHQLRRQAFVGVVQRRPDASLFTPFVRALRAAPADVRAALVDLMPRVVAGNDLGELLELLRAPEPECRAAAARALGDPHVASHAPALVIRGLAHLSRDAVEAVALSAVAGLANVAGETEYVAAVSPLIDGKNPRVAAAALEGLRRFPNERTAALLERKLASGPHALRLAALSVVEAANHDALVGVAVKALSHGHLAVRTRASEVMSALARGGRVEIGRTLVWLLRSREVGVRRMAAEVLRSVPDPSGELWPKLLSSLRDDDWWVRERVMDALVDLAGTGLSRFMVAWLADPSDVVRRFALSVLLRLKDPDTIGALVDCALHDTDWWARETAIEVIAGFKDGRALPTLVDIMNRSPELQLTCIEALSGLDAIAAAPHVLQLARAPDPDVRSGVLRFIEQLNDPVHAIVVEGLTHDEDAAVQRLARAVLARMGNALETDSAIPGLAPVTSGDVTPLDTLLRRVVQLAGDDLILAADRVAFVKTSTGVAPITEQPISAERVNALLVPLLSPALADRFERRMDVDFSYVVKATGARFRVNMFRQRGGASAVFHVVQGTVPLLDDLGLPPVVSTWCTARTGLVLIAGPTASGKSTTLAALLDTINRTSSRHIISIEDPIEVLHTPRQSLVNQREVGTHTRSFADALRSALRQDPDVLMIGELRDPETMALALTAAETGHLVFGTLNTTSADQAIERIVHAFPLQHQQQTRASIADVLRGVLCQTLLRGVDGKRRHIAAEVLVNTAAVAEGIRSGNTLELRSLIATGADAGMMTMGQDVARLLNAGLVPPQEGASLRRPLPMSDLPRFAIDLLPPEGVEGT